MKIAIVCTEKRPVPAVRGGAVETLVDLLIRDNEQHPYANLDIYSIDDSEAKARSTQFRHAHFYYMRTTDPFRPARRMMNRVCHKFRLAYFSDVFLVRTVRALKKHNYDWIIVENRPKFIKRLRRKLGEEARIALHLHNDVLNRTCYDARAVLQQCDRVLSVSKFIHARVVETTAEARRKARILYNRIDTALFSPETKGRTIHRMREQSGIPENRPVVLYYGRLCAGKGVPNLIRAFARARTVNPSFFLVLIGRFPCRKELKQIRAALKTLPEHSYTLIDYLPHDELPKLVSTADIIALPSLCHEAFGLTIAEAMALGKAVITTDAGAIPELVENRAALVVRTGRRFNERLADALLRCAANPKLRARLGAKAQAEALRRFRAEGYMEELLERLN
ncbi:glycosyltransferase family 4 protein [Sporolactobacillus sp. CPB3-1]|uniref:Glycosyltransferase family 4 protein n=1 Tax=Sporolactobacillus mangiferae TaxID=2940498 RepID=A0ABT0M9K9_9BACL|nr:glycosyltransferase family 4 protein [Sporolactobacillus mangiferae]MCL1631557.1 glycosyltransferase family 4 protein [Sporolactobacillus mangiferae]